MPITQDRMIALIHGLRPMLDLYDELVHTLKLNYTNERLMINSVLEHTTDPQAKLVVEMLSSKINTIAEKLEAGEIGIDLRVNLASEEKHFKLMSYKNARSAYMLRSSRERQKQAASLSLGLESPGATPPASLSLGLASPPEATPPAYVPFKQRPKAEQERILAEERQELAAGAGAEAEAGASPGAGASPPDIVRHLLTEAELDTIDGIRPGSASPLA